MFQLWSVKSIRFLLSRNGSKKRDSTHSLQNCLEKPKRRPKLWHLFLLILLLGVVAFYLCYQKTPVIPAYPYIEMFPANELRVMTERVEMTDIFTYENDTYIIKQVFAQAEKKVKEVSPKPAVDDLTLSQLIEDQRKSLPVCISSVRIQNFTIQTNKSKSKENAYTMITIGGSYAPASCRAKHKVGILVPYRDREQNLAVFLYNIHPFLIRQNLEYRIFVVEQFGSSPFNRGRLFNAGFLEMQQMGHWPCVIFHDVDLLPTDDRILYACSSIPRHMCASVLEKEEIKKYRTLFGGVTAMTVEQFKYVNGYSNTYWGWGGEDNDLFWRLKATGLGVMRYKKSYAKYTSLPHNETPVNEDRFDMLKTGLNAYYKQKEVDGLTTLRYTVVSYHIRHLYTHVVIDINPPPPQKENTTIDTES